MSAPQKDASRSHGDDSGATPRLIALRACLQWEQNRSIYMESTLATLLHDSDMDVRDRAFATQLAYGYVRRVNSLDVVCGHLANRFADRLDAPVRVAIDLGLYQFLYLKTPAHAAVDATMSALRTHLSASIPESQIGKATGVVNAVLRRATRECTRVPLSEGDPDDPELLRGYDDWIRVPKIKVPTRTKNVHALWGVKYSHPQEMVRVWSERLPEEVLLPILVRNNAPPKTHLVVRSDQPSLETFMERLTAAGIPTERIGAPRTVSVDTGRVNTIPGFEAGEFWVQDATARRLSLMLPQRQGGTLLDLCAAPGGKLMSLLDRGGYDRVLACDVVEDRLRRVAENVVRTRLDGTPIQFLELPEDPEKIRLPNNFDHILVDVPCSNTGVLNRRHEARWRFLPEHMRELVRRQKALFRAAMRHLATGGHLLYTTCSMEPDENSGVVHDALRGQSEVRLVEEREILPGEGGGDGGYGALLVRRE